MSRHGIRPTLAATGLLALSLSATAETINGDLIVDGSACVGSACDEAEEYPFDLLRIHDNEPRISIVDSSAPDYDWILGITDNDAAVPSHFFVREAGTGNRVLKLDVNGNVALGYPADLVKGAVSVGTPAAPRRVTHVADAVDATDAVTLRQFEDFKDEALSSVDGDASQLEQQIDDMRQRIDDLAARVDDLAAQVQ